MKGQALSTQHPTTGRSGLEKRLRENLGQHDPGYSSSEVKPGDLTFGEPQLEQE